MSWEGNPPPPPPFSPVAHAQKPCHRTLCPNSTGPEKETETPPHPRKRIEGGFEILKGVRRMSPLLPKK